jgi:phosphotransferase system HPr (HPr) family protein
MNEPLIRTVTVNNPNGLHARPADLITKLARGFGAEITLTKGRERVDAKSILGILTLAATHGTQLELRAVGDDAEQALDALEKLFESNFAEQESEIS